MKWASGGVGAAQSWPFLCCLLVACTTSKVFSFSRCNTPSLPVSQLKFLLLTYGERTFLSPTFHLARIIPLLSRARQMIAHPKSCAYGAGKEPPLPCHNNKTHAEKMISQHSTDLLYPFRSLNNNPLHRSCVQCADEDEVSSIISGLGLQSTPRRDDSNNQCFTGDSKAHM